jgi:hypothetical protein
LHAQGLVDALRRVGLVERVEVNARDVVVEEVAALFGRPVDAGVFDGLGVALAARDRLQEWRRKARARREVSHALQSAAACDWHHARDDWRANSRKFAARTPVVEGVVVEEELRDDVVGACIALRLQVLKLDKRVRRFRVAFGEACDADSEAAAAIHAEALAFLFDEAHKIGGMAKVAECKNACARWRIAAQRKHRAHTVRGVELENRADFIFRMPKAREMRHRLEFGLAPEAHHKRVRVVARGSAGAVGHRHETRRERLELCDRPVERFPAGVGLRREELEAERGRFSGEDVRNMHEERVAEQGRTYDAAP